MIFAMPSVRRVLELKSRPARDPDVKAKRLVVGDPYLNSVLYGSVDLFSGVYANSVKPQASAQRKKKPSPKSPQSKAGAKQTKSSQTNTAAIGKMPKSIDELKKLGYKQRGSISPYNTAMRLVGAKWNSPDTFYTIRNKLIPGNLINPAKIEKGMGVWRKDAK